MVRGFSILVFLVGILAFGQNLSDQHSLLGDAVNNFELLDKNPKKSYKEADRIEKEAKKLNVKEAELVAINTKCGYYRGLNDFKKMMEYAELLFRKSTEYKYPFYQVVAKRLLFESYLFTGLDKRAFQELEEAGRLMNRLDDSNSSNISEKMNLFIAYSNYYLFKEDYKNQLEYIKLAGKEIEKLPNEKQKQFSLYVHHTNLAASYNKNNLLDSAKYFAKLSLSQNENYGRNDVRFNNLKVLGDVATKQGNYEEAISYFQEAVKVEGYKNHRDIEELFDNIIEANKKLGREDNVIVYRAKKDSLKLSISENQNKSLHKLLNEEQKPNSGNYYKYIFLAFFILTLLFLFFIIRKNRIIREQERISDQYLDKYSAAPSGEDYSKLLNLLKSNDPAFMIFFEEYHPGFSSTLKKINPNISDSEIEFCALLKLKIPTKDIAKYKFIAPQTVRNKKYIIKNKLQIPKDSDIYEWFDAI